MGNKTYIVLLMVLSAAFSMVFFMGQSLRLDEAQSIWQTSRSLGGVLDVVAKDVHMPVYFVGLHYWEIIFGTSEFALRLFSLIFFLLSIPAIFYLAKEVYSDGVAYFVALITAFSPFLNWYGSEARMYSLLFLLTVLAHLFFIRIWRRPTARAWIGYGIVTFLGIFTHLFFLFIVLVQAFFFVWRSDMFPKGSGSRMLKIATLFGGAGLGWFIFRYFAGAGLTNPLLAKPTSVDFFNIFSNFFIGFQSDAVNTVFLSLWPIAVFVGFTFLAKKKFRGPETVYLIAQSFTPIILAFLISATFKPIFLSRYLIISLPALYILGIYFFSSYKALVSRVMIGALATLMIIMLGIQAVWAGSSVKEDFKGASAYVERMAAPSDLFVVSAPFITYPVEYYYKGSARLTTFPRWDRFSKDAVPEQYSAESLAKTSSEWSKVYEKVFLLLSYDQGYNDEIRLYMDTHYERLHLVEFSSGLILYVYKLRYL